MVINDSLDLGSMIPYVQDGFTNNMSIIIFNPNERKDSRTGNSIPLFNTMENHCNYVYEEIIKKYSPAKEIYIVAHSMGGYCTIDLIKRNPEDLENGLIKKIGFTDSVHGTRYEKLKNKTYKCLTENSINFVTSNKPVGTLIRRAENSRE